MSVSFILKGSEHLSKIETNPDFVKKYIFVLFMGK